MNQHYKNLKIEDVQLDMDNPRIAKYIEMYKRLHPELWQQEKPKKTTTKKGR